MPNWCNNTLELQHEDPAMIQRAVTAMKAGTFLHEFIPVPKELSEATANFSTNEALVAKYGYSDWYSFCVNEWGTKWDVGCGENCREDRLRSDWLLVIISTYIPLGTASVSTSGVPSGM